MPASPSKIILGPLQPENASLDPVFAFGDRDDAQRMAVLLAGSVAEALPQSAEVMQKAHIVQDPKSSWKKRKMALREAFTLAAEQHTGHFVALADIDALAPRGTEDWSADRSIEMRRDIYDLVLAAVEQGGWLVFRTSPARAVSSDLARLALEEDQLIAPPSPAFPEPEESNPYAPEVRPIAAWLVERGVLRARDLSRIVADVEDFDAHIVDLAYDALPPSARDAGKLLSAVRPPQHVNGKLGTFAYAEGRPTSTTIPRAAKEALCSSGFLQPSAAPSTLRMPRLARDLLRSFAQLGMSVESQQVHARLAAEPVDSARDRASISAQIETHHHAVLAGDIENAKRTARFYGTELRVLATQLSLDGNREKDRSKFSKAAELFRYIVDTFDEKDAYAWEYCGYNLARADASAHRKQVREAYEKAHTLWPENPLYHGRLLGLRGQFGEDVVYEFSRGIDRYVGQFGDEGDAVSFFAEAALKGLRRGHRHDQIRRILSDKRTLLDRFAPRALKLVENA